MILPPGMSLEVLFLEPSQATVRLSAALTRGARHTRLQFLLHDRQLILAVLTHTTNRKSSCGWHTVFVYWYKSERLRPCGEQPPR
jgi:hypothetical protein